MGRKRLFFKPWVLGLSILLVMAILLAGCEGGPKSEKAKEPLKLGVLIPLSGVAAEGGRQMRDGFEMAKEEINQAGGVLGRPLDLIYYDTETTTEKAVRGARKLLDQDGVYALLHGFMSGETMALAEVAADYKVLLFEHTAAAPEITGLVAKNYNRYKYVFRVGAIEDDFIQNSLAFVTEIVKAKSYYFLGNDIVLSRSLREGYRKVLEPMGIKEVGAALVKPGTTEFAAILRDIREKQPDVVISTNVMADAVPLARQYYDAKINAPFICIGGLLASQKVIQGMGPQSDYLAFVASTYNVPKTDKTQPFYKKFTEKYGYFPSGYEDVRSYDGLWLLAEAINRAGTLEKEKVISSLEQLDYPGVAGRYVFNNEHQVKWGKDFITGVVGQWIGGEAHILWPYEVADSKLKKAPWWR